MNSHIYQYTVYIKSHASQYTFYIKKSRFSLYFLQNSLSLILKLTIEVKLNQIYSLPWAAQNQFASLENGYFSVIQMFNTTTKIHHWALPSVTQAQFNICFNNISKTDLLAVDLLTYKRWYVSITIFLLCKYICYTTCFDHSSGHHQVSHRDYSITEGCSHILGSQVVYLGSQNVCAAFCNPVISMRDLMMTTWMVETCSLTYTFT